MTELSGRLVTPYGVKNGTIAFSTLIQRIQPGSVSGPYILPGFIDTHVHGGGGSDTMDGAEGVRRLARFHLGHGTTTLYPTTITNPWERIVRALQGVKAVQQDSGVDLPDIPGAHLEGPFIDPQRLGAQPPHAQVPTPEKVATLVGLAVVKLVTLAPELPGMKTAAKMFAGAGIRLSIGHTRATFEEVRNFTDAVRSVGGIVGFTHLYNAMGGLQGREPGAVGAALADSQAFAEVILDLHHVHPASFLVARQAKPHRLHLITDSIRASGHADGESELGGQRVAVANGCARLADGTLAGSLLTLDQAFKNALGLGLELGQVSQHLSAVPARYMGLRDRGTLEPGLRADLIVLDDDLNIQSVYVAGRHVYQAGRKLESARYD